ncbi:complex I subunit 4 family protein [Desmospora profundinema]|uniref:NADH-quinone oxidoreductase subunit M n=1 Tax=Desmospora profundinema TaxID=1571184 RepID=A0ABU1IL76_9BACL|nr:NADH-quinone oxidoreductase subunit M [Desmospora profundinema]MDR6225529.1 NADH-quinone oxidoreductase subunit M [Desmospora profundinema]
MKEGLLQMLPTWLAFSPLLGVLVLLAIPRERTAWIRGVGVAATFPPLVLAWLMAAWFDPAVQGVQFQQKVEWISIPIQQGVAFDIQYHMGVDGLSIPLVVLTSVIATIAAVASRYVRERLKGYFLVFLLLEMGALGVFLARDLFLFFLFFEVTLVSLFFLIGIWGAVYREKAANLFLLYNGLGSAFLLLGIIGILFLFQTLDLEQLRQISTNPELAIVMEQDPFFRNLVWGVFLALVIAFGIKLPVFPFHTWMVRVHTEAPPAVVMVHAGVLLKMGAYGLIRFGVDLFPIQTSAIAAVLGVLGVVNMLYGAVLAFVQNDLRRVLAFSSISHMGIILIGIASLHVVGLQGAVFQAVSHGLIAALLFFFIGALHGRTRTTDMRELGGLSRSVPVLSGIWMAGGLALLGLPGMSGFIAEFFAFLGFFRQFPILAAVGVIGLVGAAAYSLRAVLNTNFGPLPSRWASLPDAKPIESASMLVLLGFIILIGVWPAVLEEPMQTTLRGIAAKMGG